MFLIKVISVLSVFACSEICCTNLKPVSINMYESAGKCVSKIVNQYFSTNNPNINLFFINNSRDDKILSLVYQSQVHVKTLRDFTRFKVNFTDVKRRFAIIAAESLTELILYRHQFPNLNLWNAKARYIFIIRKNSLQNIDEAVDLMWHNYIINGLITMPAKNNKTVQEIYSWFPYENGLCGENFKARIIDVCEYGRFKENVDLFPQKVPDVVNKCPVRARAIIWPPFVMSPDDNNIRDNVPVNISQGVEVMLLKTAAEIMNINAQIMTSTVRDNWGIATMDGNTTGNIRSLVLKEIEMSFGSYGPMLERRVYCDYTISHYIEGVTWCVPRAQLRPRWQNLLDTFQHETWLAIIGMYLLFSTIIWCLCACEPKDMTPYVRFQNSLHYLFSIFLGIAVFRTPKKFSGRIAFLFWIGFCMHFIAAYQAKMISVLLHPSYETQLKTVEEILTSGMQWGAIPSLKRFFANTDDWRVRIINRDWRPCKDADACLHRIAYKRDFALLLLSEHAKYEVLSYLDPNWQSKIYCFPKVYLTYPSEMYLTKGFPFRDRLNTLFYRIKEAGFMPKWQNDLHYSQFIKQLKILNEKHPKDMTTQLTYKHLEGAFMIFEIGMGCAIFGFIGELVFYKMNVKRFWEKRNGE